MNIACFRIHLRQTKRLLQKMGLLGESNIEFGCFEPSEATKEAGRGDDFYALYECIQSNYDYEFRLKDGSYLQLAYLSDGLRYAFIESVAEKLSFEDFIIKEGLDMDEVRKMSEEDYNIYRECYDAEVDSLKQKIYPLYIRYDYTKKSVDHIPNIHSSAHIHFGWHNKSRIPCSKIVTPEGFVCFAIKMYSPAKWKELLEKEIITSDDYGFKGYFEELGTEYWTKEEQRDLYLI